MRLLARDRARPIEPISRYRLLLLSLHVSISENLYLRVFGEFRFVPVKTEFLLLAVVKGAAEDRAEVVVIWALLKFECDHVVHVLIKR